MINDRELKLVDDNYNFVCAFIATFEEDAAIAIDMSKDHLLNAINPKFNKQDLVKKIKPNDEENQNLVQFVSYVKKYLEESDEATSKNFLFYSTGRPLPYK